MKRFIPIAFLFLLPSCATIIKGGTQTVAVNTTPSGSSCTIDRTGARVGMIPSTPGSLILQRSSNELVVTCNKDGYTTATKMIPAGFNGVTFGNILLGGVIGIVVDASTGANNSYPEMVSVELVTAPTSPPAATQVPVAAASQPYVSGTPIRLTPIVQPVIAPAPPTSAPSPKI